MKKATLSLLFGILILMAACQGTASSDMEFKFKGKQAKFEKVNAYLRTGNSGIYSLGIANYELDATKPFGDSDVKPKQDGQFLLDVSMTIIDEKLENDFFAEEGFTDDSNASHNPRVIDFGVLSYFEGGEVKREDMRIDANTKRSTVKFSKPNGDTTDVFLNIVDEDGRSMNGKFTAKIIKAY